MLILATVSDTRRLGVILDLESGRLADIPAQSAFLDTAIRDRPPLRPFGITWNRRELFVANHRKLLVLDRRLRYLRTLSTPLQANVHQLSYGRGRVWAVSPWTNSLIGVQTCGRSEPVELDLLNVRLRPYVHRSATVADDENHFNSLLWADQWLFVAAHNFGPTSFILRLDAASLHLDHTIESAGHSIHGLAWDSGELMWISTMTGDIRSDRGYSVPLSRAGYARGFAVTREYFVVAFSEFLRRGRRHTGDSWVQLINRTSGVAVEEFHLEGTGSINDLRLLDCVDLAHGIDPFWAASPADALRLISDVTEPDPRLP